MRIFHVADQFTELGGLPQTLPETGFLWIAAGRREFEVRLAAVQDALQKFGGMSLVELHVTDLLNSQLPSQFDSTSAYDLMVFRRLAATAHAGTPPTSAGTPPPEESDGTISSAQAALAAIDTRAVGFGIFERILLTVHPTDCQVREFFVTRLSALNHSAGSETRGSTRLPSSPDDLMLRIVNHIVDSYLDLRRLLTKQMGYLQKELLRPQGRHTDWAALLDCRNVLHQLEDICEDQQSAIQEWIDALAEWPAPTTPQARDERDLLRVRARDVAEHIERVLGHVRRLAHSLESAVQIHFSAVSQRTGNVMRTLTVITAIFLPLNLITGFFGMNFDALPLIHSSDGMWLALGLMLMVGAGLVVFFWRKRYLSSH